MTELFVLIIRIFLVSIAMFASSVLSETAPVVQCNGQVFENLNERIQIIPCGKTRCKLTRGTTTIVKFKFKPENIVNTLTNNVYAEVAGYPFPYLGVSGTDACSKVTWADDGSPALCPLAPNNEYFYSNVLIIEPSFPQINLKVHWSLNDGTRDVICFEVPAVIMGAKKTY